MIEDAARYLAAALERVGPADLDAPTPCTEWTVRDLLAHLGDATAALLEAVDGAVDVEPRFGGSVLARARLLAAGGVPAGSVRIGDRALDGDLLDAAGALELAVHGWDLNAALGRTDPIPETLARRLLSAGLPIDQPEFAPATTPPPAATAAGRLLSSLGREIMPNSPLDQLTDAVGEFEKVLAGIGQDQWALPSPCSEWTVRDVANHVQVGNRQFAAAVAGTPEGPWRREPDADLLGDKPVAAFRDLADAMLVAFGQPGALDRVVTVGIGAVQGIAALHLRIVELLVHGWDLARATGQRPGFDEDTAAHAYAFTKAKLADVPAGSTSFAPPKPAPAGASALDQLAALLGRDVG